VRSDRELSKIIDSFNAKLNRKRGIEGTDAGSNGIISLPSFPIAPNVKEVMAFDTIINGKEV
jgi:hypothetical protein